MLNMVASGAFLVVAGAGGAQRGHLSTSYSDVEHLDVGRFVIGLIYRGQAASKSGPSAFIKLSISRPGPDSKRTPSAFNRSSLSIALSVVSASVYSMAGVSSGSKPSRS